MEPLSLFIRYSFCIDRERRKRVVQPFSRWFLKQRKWHLGEVDLIEGLVLEEDWSCQVSGAHMAGTTGLVPPMTIPSFVPTTMSILSRVHFYNCLSYYLEQSVDKYHYF